MPNKSRTCPHVLTTAKSPGVAAPSILFNRRWTASTKDQSQKKKYKGHIQLLFDDCQDPISLHASPGKVRKGASNPGKEGLEQVGNESERNVW